MTTHKHHVLGLIFSTSNENPEFPWAKTLTNTFKAILAIPKSCWSTWKGEPSCNRDHKATTLRTNTMLPIQWKQLHLTWLLNCRPLAGSLAATSRIQNTLSQSTCTECSWSPKPSEAPYGFCLGFFYHPPIFMWNAYGSHIKTRPYYELHSSLLKGLWRKQHQITYFKHTQGPYLQPDAFLPYRPVWLNGNFYSLEPIYKKNEMTYKMTWNRILMLEREKSKDRRRAATSIPGALSALASSTYKLMWSHHTTQQTNSFVTVVLKCVLLLERTRVQYPAPLSDGSQLAAILVLRNPMSSSDSHRYLHQYAPTHTWLK